MNVRHSYKLRDVVRVLGQDQFYHDFRRDDFFVLVTAFSTIVLVKPERLFKLFEIELKSLFVSDDH